MRTASAPRGSGGPEVTVTPEPVFVNGRFLCQPAEGVHRAAAEIVRGLDTLLREGVIDPARYRLVLLVPNGPRRHLPLHRIAVESVGRLRGHAWEQFELPWFARGGVLLSLCNAAPIAKRKQIATMYDAAVFAAPGGYSRAFYGWYRVLFRMVGRTAHSVLTASDFSRGELVRHARIRDSKIRVVPLGAHHLDEVAADRSVLDRHELRGIPFVLAVGSRNPNKNFGAVLEAMRLLAEPRPKLVVAGGANPRVFRGAGDPEPDGDDVRHVGYVSDAELKALYEAATVFVFPSVYEGFGFPPLEAMAAGCPVAVSDLAVLREVCGDAAAYFDPRDPRDLARVVGGLLADGRARDALRVRGSERVLRYTWSGSALGVWDAIRAATQAEP